MYHDIKQLLAKIEEPQGGQCTKLFWENCDKFKNAPGSSHNHQTWPGGYLDHVVECMNIAIVDYEQMRALRGVLPFSLSDALLVLFLHDLEKPWKYTMGHECVLFDTKGKGRAFRAGKIQEYGIELTSEQENALRYVEGEGDDYSSQHRVMGPLAAFCHRCDVASARIWFDYPRKDRRFLYMF